MKKSIDGYITRHSLKPSQTNPESDFFKGITEAGVELAKSRAAEIAQLVEDAEAGTIIFQGGVSPEVRTRWTMQVYASALQERFKDREDIIVFDRASLSDFTKDKGFSDAATQILRSAEERPDAKIVIDLPLRLTEMMDLGWFGKDGKPSKYTEHLLSSGGSLFEMEKRWFLEKGMIEGKQVGPNPREVARNLLHSFERLRNFAKKFFPERPIVIGCVGHSFELDALLAYIAGNGKIDVMAYEALQKNIIHETEMITLSLQENEIVAHYRGRDMKISKEMPFV